MKGRREQNWKIGGNVKSDANGMWDHSQTAMVGLGKNLDLRAKTSQYTNSQSNRKSQTNHKKPLKRINLTKTDVGHKMTTLALN